MMQQRLCNDRLNAKGFTFIELVVTLAIMGIILLIAVPMAQLGVQRGKEHELRVALAQIRDALDAYKKASEQGRILLKIDNSGYPTTLHDLVDGVEDQRSPVHQRMYFLRKLPPDPFYPGKESDPALTWGLRSYDSPPDDPKMGKDIFDVYSKSDKIGLNGVPYRKW